MLVSRRQIPLTLASGVSLIAAEASAQDTGGGSSEAFSDAERAQLRAGAMVSRPKILQGDPRRYVGGTSYIVASEATGRVRSMMDEVGLYAKVLPRVQAATLIGQNEVAPGTVDRFVTIEHNILSVSYTLRMRSETSGIRFWLDLTRRHDIEEAWGFLRLSPWRDDQAQSQAKPQLLIRFGIFVAIGESLLEGAVEGRLQRAMLSLPQRMKTYLEQHPG
jgi:hypothetical protein